MKKLKTTTFLLRLSILFCINAYKPYYGKKLETNVYLDLLENFNKNYKKITDNLNLKKFYLHLKQTNLNLEEITHSLFYLLFYP